MIQSTFVHDSPGVDRDFSVLWATLVADALFVTRNRADAEDVVQCAFVRAFEHSESLGPGTNLQAWLRTVVRRLGIDLLRRRRRHPRCGADETERLTAPTPEPTPIWRWVSDDVLAAALELCEPTYRDILVLHYVQRESYAAIGERLQLPMGTVATRLHRGRSMLRKKLELLLGLDQGAPTPAHADALRYREAAHSGSTRSGSVARRQMQSAANAPS